jgi:hypothetical protein
MDPQGAAKRLPKTSKIIRNANKTVSTSILLLDRLLEAVFVRFVLKSGTETIQNHKEQRPRGNRLIFAKT